MIVNRRHATLREVECELIVSWYSSITFWCIQAVFPDWMGLSLTLDNKFGFCLYAIGLFRAVCRHLLRHLLYPLDIELEYNNKMGAASHPKLAIEAMPYWSSIILMRLSCTHLGRGLRSSSSLFYDKCIFLSSAWLEHVHLSTSPRVVRKVRHIIILIVWELWSVRMGESRTWSKNEGKKITHEGGEP